MPPSSRGLDISRARLEPIVCLRCSLWLERRFSTSNLFSSRSPLPLVQAHRRNRKLALFDRGNMHPRGLTEGQHSSLFQIQPNKLFQYSRQLYNGQIRRHSVLDQRAPGKLAKGSVACAHRKPFATHVDMPPPGPDDSLKIFRPRRQGKVDIKTKLRAWEQEYEKSDEATQPYIASLGGSAAIRAKPNNKIDMVQNPRDSAMGEDNEIGYGSELEDATGMMSVGTSGLEASFLARGDLVELK